MGILQSKSLDTERDDAISRQNWSDLISLEKSCPASSVHQWQHGDRPTRSHQTTHVTISVPERSSSITLAPTNVNDIGPPPLPKSYATVCGVERTNTRRREEVPVTVKCREGKWIKHYSSWQRILLVGEGDFSFSTCLATAFGVASNMVATSLDSSGFLVSNYGSALSNLVELSIRKCRVIHGVDATEMATHALLAGIKFDRIVFNFPYAGFFKDLPRDAQLRLHRRLVSRFMENAKEMLSENGEIHITHKTNGFHAEWKVELLATLHRLRLVEVVEFNQMEYPGYNTKYGFGGDNNFNCNPSITYKFRL